MGTVHEAVITYLDRNVFKERHKFHKFIVAAVFKPAFNRDTIVQLKNQFEHECIGKHPTNLEDVKTIITDYSILFTYLYMAPLAVKTNQSEISPRKKRGLKKTMSRGKRARENLSLSKKAGMADKTR